MLFANWGGLQQFAGLIKFQTWAAREEFGRIAVAEIAQEIGFDTARRKFVFNPGDFGASRRKKLLIHFGIIEPRHGAAIQADGAGGKNEITALQSAVAKRREFGQLRRIGEDVAHTGI